MKWFEEQAPIRLKLASGFSLLVALVCVAVASQGFVEAGTIGSRASMAIGGAAVCMAIIASVVMRSYIAEPYVATVVRMEALARGDLTSPIRYTGYTDCVGRMTKAMHAFQEGAVAKIQAESEAATICQSAHTDRQQTEAERARVASQQSEVIALLGRALERMSAGDLTTRIDQQFLR